MLRAPEGFSFVMGIGMATFILFLGGVLLFTDLYVEVIRKPNRNYLAFIFFAYAGFRYWRAWQTYKKSQRDREREKWEQHKK